MRKRFFLFLLVFCLLLTSCASASPVDTEPALNTDSVEIQTAESDTEASSEFEDQPVEPDTEAPTASENDQTPELSERDRNWISDIHYLQNQYKMYHPDPFYLYPEEDFDRNIDQLCQKVNSLSDNDIFFELAAIIAGLGDLHTKVIPPNSLYDYTFPFGVSYYNDRLYLSFYLEGYEQFEPYLLREIVAVNGVDISYLERKFESIINPNNTWNSKEIFCVAYFIPAFFDWAGCGYQDDYTFQILDENQNVQSIEVPIVSCDEYISTPQVFPESWSYLSDTKEGNWTEYREGENGGYVYIYLVDIRSLGEAPYRELFEKAAGLLEAHPDCNKLVIDLRSNPGGAMIVPDYLREDVQILKALSINQTYILIGGYTMSAATCCISLFKEELDAVTVGEPTGQFASFFYYDHSMELVLPLSRLSVSVATGWYEGSDFAGTAYDENGRLYEWESTILPDVYIHPDIEDARQGKTSALEWILAQ